jgi:alpha-L-rhamnosidase
MATVVKIRLVCLLVLVSDAMAAEPSPTLVASEFINEHATYPQCHASTIAEVAPGKLVAAWFGGTRERAPDVGIWVARRENGRWLDAVEVANGAGVPTWNPVLFQPKQGPLVLFYKIGPSPSQWWGMMMTSPDGGKTWSQPVRLPPGVLGPIKNKPVTLADGAWLCPSSTEGTNGWRVHFELTRDAGKTWQIAGPVESNKLEAIQPSVLFHRDGRLQALCRTRNGVIGSTWSRDAGQTWSALEPTGLPNPNSGIDAVMLADGRQLLVYNHSAPKTRYPLDVAISDNGTNWQHVLTLENEPRPAGYAYPAVIQTADGLVHITYTWDRKRIKHVVINPGVAGWQAQWIGGPTNAASIVLHREFEVKPGLRHATVDVCGLGQYEMTLNGRKVGDDLLTPGWTDYRKTCLYDKYSLELKEGRNTIELLLGGGMYNVPATTNRFAKFRGAFGLLKAIAQIRLEYDGHTEFVGTDDRWLASAGPLTFASIYGGEDYDARWAPQWEPATVMTGPGGQLKGPEFAAPPIRAFDVLKPVKVTEPKPGVRVYDLGQNAAQMPRVTVRGEPGGVVKITPAELLNDDGTTFSQWAKRGSVYWLCTLASTNSETYFPKFFYYGCRYLQVETTNAVVESIEGVVVHSSAKPVGEFACSNELFNRIHALVRWAQRSNMMSVLTDCPHREKLGWLEQYHLNGPALRYEFDLAQLYRKCFQDMADAQHDNGLVPDIAPEYVKFQGGFLDSPEWGSAFILAAWQQYEFAGDLEPFRQHFDAMKRYVDYLGSTASNNIVAHGLGDWFDLGPKKPGLSQLTPIALTATAHYYADVVALSKAAKLLGRSETFHPDEIRAAFIREFPMPTNSQCAAAIALTMNLTTNRAVVLDALVRDVREKGLTAGDVGYRYLLRALADNGRSDVIFEMNNQSEKPGYGYQLARGATSLTEAWDAGRQASQNHFMLGQINEWFYHDLAGIQPAEPGFKEIIIKPHPVGDLKWVEASYESVHGPIRVRWERDGTGFLLKTTIPAGTTATIFLPGQPGVFVGPGHHEFGSH